MNKFMKNLPILLTIAMVAATLLMGGCFRKRIDSAPPAKRPATQPAPAPSQAPEPIAEPQAAEEPAEIIDETYEVDAVEEKALPQVEEGDLGEDNGLTEEAAQTEEDAEPIAEPATEATPEAVTEPAVEAAAEPQATEVGVEPADEAAAPVAEPAAATATAATPEPTPESKAAPTPEATAEPVADTFIDPEEEVVEVDDGPEFVTMGEMYYVQIGAFSKSANAENVLADVIAQGYEGSKITMSKKGLYLVRVGGYTDNAGATEAMKALKDQFPSCYIVKWDPAAK